MKLNELLDKLVADGKISAEESQSISNLTNGIRDAAVVKANKDKDAEIKTLTSNLEEANEKLAPILKKERADKLLTLLPKNAKKDLAEDIISLSGITDEMDDEAIKAALKDTVANRTYLQAEPVSTSTPKVEESSLFGSSAPAEAPGKSDIFE